MVKRAERVESWEKEPAGAGAAGGAITSALAGGRGCEQKMGHTACEFCRLRKSLPDEEDLSPAIRQCSVSGILECFKKNRRWSEIP